MHVMKEECARNTQQFSFSISCLPSLSFISIWYNVPTRLLIWKATDEIRSVGVCNNNCTVCARWSSSEGNLHSFSTSSIDNIREPYTTTENSQDFKLEGYYFPMTVNNKIFLFPYKWACITNAEPWTDVVLQQLFTNVDLTQRNNPVYILAFSYDCPNRFNIFTVNLAVRTNKNSF